MNFAGVPFTQLKEKAKAKFVNKERVDKARDDGRRGSSLRNLPATIKEW